MFSYRHGFHAGNHADVLKHIVLSQIIEYFNEKPGPYWYVDTHAGAGVYDLTGNWANARQEYLGGITRVMAEKKMPDAINSYIEVIKGLNPDNTLSFYPGSPWVAMSLIRPIDRIKLFEMLPVEADILKRNLSKVATLRPRQLHVSIEDGFLALKALMPPTSRRAITLIDPSYENKHDYRYVLNTVKDAVMRFPTGCFMVWYPIVQRLDAQQLPKHLAKVCPDNWLDMSLVISKPPKEGLGLYGSGVIVINPPWTLRAAMQKVLPWLRDTLAVDESATYSINGQSK